MFLRIWSFSLTLYIKSDFGTDSLIKLLFFWEMWSLSTETDSQSPVTGSRSLFDGEYVRR